MSDTVFVFRPACASELVFYALLPKQRKPTSEHESGAGFRVNSLILYRVVYRFGVCSNVATRKS